MEMVRAAAVLVGFGILLGLFIGRAIGWIQDLDDERQNGARWVMTSSTNLLWPRTLTCSIDIERELRDGQGFLWPPISQIQADYEACYRAFLTTEFVERQLLPQEQGTP